MHPLRSFCPDAHNVQWTHRFIDVNLGVFWKSLSKYCSHRQIIDTFQSNTNVYSMRVFRMFFLLHSFLWQKKLTDTNLYLGHSKMLREKTWRFAPKIIEREKNGWKVQTSRVFIHFRFMLFFVLFRYVSARFSVYKFFMGTEWWLKMDVDYIHTQTNTHWMITVSVPVPVCVYKCVVYVPIPFQLVTCIQCIFFCYT